jgi:integrase
MPRRAPNTENRTVAIRRPNRDLRTREYLTPGEVRKLMAAARKNRHGHRDATMILVTYRHGLRATEVCQLRWDQFDLKRGSLHVNRIKNGIPKPIYLTPSKPVWSEAAVRAWCDEKERGAA